MAPGKIGDCMKTSPRYGLAPAQGVLPPEEKALLSGNELLPPLVHLQGCAAAEASSPPPKALPYSALPVAGMRPRSRGHGMTQAGSPRPGSGSSRPPRLADRPVVAGSGTGQGDSKDSEERGKKFPASGSFTSPEPGSVKRDEVVFCRDTVHPGGPSAWSRKLLVGARRTWGPTQFEEMEQCAQYRETVHCEQLGDLYSEAEHASSDEDLSTWLDRGRTIRTKNATVPGSRGIAALGAGTAAPSERKGRARAGQPLRASVSEVCESTSSLGPPYYGCDAVCNGGSDALEAGDLYSLGAELQAREARPQGAENLDSLRLLPAPSAHGAGGRWGAAESAEPFGLRGRVHGAGRRDAGRAEPGKGRVPRRRMLLSQRSDFSGAEVEPSGWSSHSSGREDLALSPASPADASWHQGDIAMVSSRSTPTQTPQATAGKQGSKSPQEGPNSFALGPASCPAHQGKGSSSSSNAEASLRFSRSLNHQPTLCEDLYSMDLPPEGGQHLCTPWDAEDKASAVASQPQPPVEEFTQRASIGGRTLRRGASAPDRALRHRGIGDTQHHQQEQQQQQQREATRLKPSGSVPNACSVSAPGIRAPSSADAEQCVVVDAHLGLQHSCQPGAPGGVCPMGLWLGEGIPSPHLPSLAALSSLADLSTKKGLRVDCALGEEAETEGALSLSPSPMTSSKLGPGARGSGRGGECRAPQGILQRPYVALGHFYALGERLLGVGARATLVECVELASGQHYACKSVEKRHLKSESAITGILNEVSCMEALAGHPSITQLQGVFEDEKSIHLVMDLCEGGDLHDFVTKHGCLTEQEAAGVCHRVVTALLGCHSHGIMHRDVKPENILLPRRGAVHNAVLADFGAAAFFMEGQCLRDFAGTPEYMAPEVFCGAYGPAGDVWGVGALVYFLLCGETPLWDSSPSVCGAKTKGSEEREEGGVRFESLRWSCVSDSCKEAITRMLRKDPVERICLQDVLGHAWLRFAGL